MRAAAISLLMLVACRHDDAREPGGQLAAGVGDVLGAVRHRPTVDDLIAGRSERLDEGRAGLVLTRPGDDPVGHGEDLGAEAQVRLRSIS